MAMGYPGLAFDAKSLRRYGIFFIAAVVFAVAEFSNVGYGYPVSSRSSSPLSARLLLDEEEGEPSLVSLRLDDLIEAYHRRGGFNFRPSLQRPRDESTDVGNRPDPQRRVIDDDDGSKLEALKAELDRQTGEIGELTESLIRDEGQIVELRTVVCRLLLALCDSKGSPCLDCPWKDLPTEPPATATTTTSEVTTATPTPASTTTATSTTPAPSTSSEASPSTAVTEPTTPFTTTPFTTASQSHTPSTTSAASSTTATPTTIESTTSLTTSSASPTTSGHSSTTTPSKRLTTTTAAPTKSSTKTPLTTTKAPTTDPTTSTQQTTTTTTITTMTTTTPKPTPDPSAKCDDPKPPDNGFIVGNETKLGSRVEVKCKPGFTLVGVPMMECTALWSDETHSFSYNWAPPMSAVCKANANYVAPIKPPKTNKGKGKTRGKAKLFRRKRNVPAKLDEACKERRLVGRCRAAIPRYFYNFESQECEPFIFGGCGGNKNNFVTLERCKETCGLL